MDLFLTGIDFFKALIMVCDRPPILLVRGPVRGGTFWTRVASILVYKPREGRPFSNLKSKTFCHGHENHCIPARKYKTHTTKCDQSHELPTWTMILATHKMVFTTNKHPHSSSLRTNNIQNRTQIINLQNISHLEPPNTRLKPCLKPTTSDAT